MKLLLTGASGQVGSCVQELAKAKYPQLQLLATDRSTLDITDAQAVKKIVDHFQPDVILNAAAYTAVDRAESDEHGAWAVNVTAVENLTLAAKSCNAFFIHISTDYVFNGESETPFTEEEICDPQSVYGTTKLAGEQIAISYENSVILRTSWVFSEFGNNFLKTMLRLGSERTSLSIVDDQRGCPTYAGDIASAALEIALASIRPTGVFHYTGLGEVSWFQFAREILQKANADGMLPSMPEIIPIPTEKFPTPAKRPKYSVLNTSKISSTGIQPQDWVPGVHKVLRKLKSDSQ